jgi:hypothetical protein
VVETNLVQRLRRPWRRSGEPAPMTSRVFLPTTAPGTPQWKEAASLLHKFVSCDTMGAAEYEFGTFRDAVASIARDSDAVVAGQMVLTASEIPRNHRRDVPVRTTRGQPKKKQPIRPPVVDRTVYLLCRGPDAEQVQERVRQLAKGRWRVKMGTRFEAALDPVESWDAETVGWLELNNGFFFFLDKDMWAATAMMFTGKVAQ